MVCAKQYYSAGIASGHSIPASEHSTITSWGPEGLVACVSDSFNIWTACKEYWGTKLKDLIKGRISGDKFGRLIVRPDSGDPAETCTKIMEILCKQFEEDVTITKT